METKRLIRPILVLLIVFYALNGVYVVLKRLLVAMVERYAAQSLPAFIKGSSVAEFVLFTIAVGVCLCLAACLSRGRLRTALFVLTAAQAVIASGNLLAPFVRDYTLALSSVILLVSAGFTVTGYGLLAHTAHDLRAIGWLCAAAAGLNQLCSAFSAFSATMIGGETHTLWFHFFVRAAQFSSVLSILACVLQALCFLFLLFAVQRADKAPEPAAPLDAAPEKAE